MATLSSEQRTDLIADMDIEGVYSTDELDRLYTRAGGDFDKTKVYILRQLLSSSRKFARYRQGQSTEDRQQIRANIRDELDYWEEKTGLSGSTLSFGVIDTGLDQEESNA